MNKLAKLAGESTAAIMISDHQMFMLLLNSIGLGIILVIATFYEVKYLSEYAGLDVLEAEDADDKDGSPESIKPKPHKKKIVSNKETAWSY